MHKKFLIFCLLICLLCTVSSCQRNYSIIEPSFSPCIGIEDGTIDQNLEELFRVHVLLLSESIPLFLNDEQENLSFIKKNLEINKKELRYFFSQVYNPEMATRFQQLLKEQMELFFQYMYAMKTYNKSLCTKLALRLRNQGDLFVEFLSLNNPYFALQVEKIVMEEHVLLMIKQVDAYFTHNLDRFEQLREIAVPQIEEFSHHIIKAIEKQIGTPCE